MPKFVDLTGRIFGYYTVLGVAQRAPVKWLCRCKCGNERAILTGSLTTGNSKSCGCWKKEAGRYAGIKTLDMTGKKYGRLTPIHISGKTKDNRCIWECVCDCGKIVNVPQPYLRRPHASCGCLCREILRANGRKTGGKTFVDISGQQFGYLHVIGRAEGCKNIPRWLCRCLLCGNLAVKIGKYLKKGYTLSCGCLRSRGERRLIEILTARSLCYEHNKHFEDCRGVPTEKRKTGSPLYFDFVIYQDGSVAGIIEYDGQSHFEPHYNSDAEGFKRALERDRIKDEYCRVRNIPLLRIKYTEFDRLEEITDEFLRHIRP